MGRTGAIILAFFSLAIHAKAQQKQEATAKISYIAGPTVYLTAGGIDGVAPGDSARVYREGALVGSLIVTAIADSSSAARALNGLQGFRIGDTVQIVLSNRLPAPLSTQVVSKGGSSSTSERSVSGESFPRANVLSGRVGLQYDMIAAEDSKLNLSQPGALVQIGISNLFGAGMSFRLYGMSFLDGNGVYAQYGNRTGLSNNLYSATLTGETAGSALGYSIGRQNSQFVSGMGTFDGGQVYFRINRFTIGALGGASATIPSSTLGYSGTKTAAFINYHSGADVFHQFDGTAAYGLQMVGGKLDRNYLYLQNSLSLGSNLNFYESTEIDLSRESNGTRVGGLNFSNTFFSMNYYPTSWLFANLGYDAYRTVYLFQTMKAIPDSLIDPNVSQGLRASISAHVTASLTLTANGSYRTRRDYARSEHTLGGSVRTSNLLDLGIGASVRYLTMTGVYSIANDVNVEIDRTFFDALDVTLSYDSYSVSVSTVEQTYKTQTISAFIDYDFSQKWYSTIGLDDGIDPSMNSFRVFAEIGFRF